MRHWFWVAFTGIVLGHAGLAEADGKSDLGGCFVAYFQNDYDTALTLCTRALESGDLAPDETIRALNNRGAVYSEGKGKYDLAIHDYDRVIHLKPDNANAYNNRGTAYLGKGDYDRAIQDYSQAIRLDPSDDAAYLGRAAAYSSQGAYQPALEDLDQAIRLSPSSSYASLQRGYVLFELARFGDAAAAFEKYVRDNPEVPDGVLWLAMTQRRAGKSDDDVLRVQAKALDLQKWPGPVVRLYLGEISQDALRAVAAADPDPVNAKLHSCGAAFYIAELDLVSGQAEAAKTGFQHVIDECPKRHVGIRVAKAELGRM
jgi:lipoprotein NlpI